MCARARVHVRVHVCACAWADASAQRHCRLIGVEAEGADAMARSLVAGERVYLKDIARFADSTSSAATSAPGLGSPRPHLHRDWAHPCHICTRTGPAPATSAPGLVGRRCVVYADAAKLARSDVRARKHNHPTLRLQRRKQQRLRGLRPHPKMRGCPPASWHGMPHEHGGQPALPLRWQVQPCSLGEEMPRIVSRCMLHVARPALVALRVACCALHVACCALPVARRLRCALYVPLSHVACRQARPCTKWARRRSASAMSCWTTWSPSPTTKSARFTRATPPLSASDSAAPRRLRCAVGARAYAYAHVFWEGRGRGAASCVTLAQCRPTRPTDRQGVAGSVAPAGNRGDVRGHEECA